MAGRYNPWLSVKRTGLLEDESGTVCDLAGTVEDGAMRVKRCG
jgi:hypothetical protein